MKNGKKERILPKNTGKKVSDKKTKGKTVSVKKADNNIKNVKVDKKSLKVRFLGGVGEIGKNMTALEFGKDIIIIDVGLTFPSDNMPGVDLVIPDVTYLEQNRNKIRGIIITHGHEDHIGALPYIMKEISAPIYGTKLTLTLIENKAENALAFYFYPKKIKNKKLL